MTNPIYLDYNASTPVDPRVLQEMLPYLKDKFGNPSSSHPYGVALKAGIEQARERVAALLGCEASEIIFTSGATESNNMVIKGVAALAPKGKPHHHLPDRTSRRCSSRAVIWNITVMRSPICALMNTAGGSR